ncbi:biotin transporter BioY [Clostridia bacterium]|nr:biotin transporter BioY [Clostridia bacterium]
MTSTKNKRPLSRKIAFCAIFTALIAVGAQITVPMEPIPFTLQTLFVMMAGLLLKPSWSAVSAAVYMALGLVGAPVFAGFMGGAGTVFSPSFGFIIGFIAGAPVMGIVAAKLPAKTETLWRMFISAVAGLIPVYLIGCVYMHVILTAYLHMDGITVGAILNMGLIPFIPVECMKMIVACGLASKLRVPLNKQLSAD